MILNYCISFFFSRGNEFRQMTSSEPSNKASINKIYRHHPNKSLDAKSGGGGTAAMKKREFDNVDNMSFSQKEEKVSEITSVFQQS